MKIIRKILLYLLVIIFAIISLACAIYHPCSQMVEIAVYAIAAVIALIGGLQLFSDIRVLIKKIMISKLNDNVYVTRLADDYRFRTFVFSTPGLISNVVFGLFNGIAGILYDSAWMGSMSAYYILLSIMRINAVQKERTIRNIHNEKYRKELEMIVYRKSSILFILIAVVLMGMVILLEVRQGGKCYDGIIIYAVATYTFYKIIMAVCHLFKASKQDSPLLMTVRKIGYIDACTSILTLQSAMFVSFAKQEKFLPMVMNGITGTFVCIMVLGIGVHGILMCDKQNRHIINGENEED